MKLQTLYSSRVHVHSPHVTLFTMGIPQHTCNGRVRIRVLIVSCIVMTTLTCCEINSILETAPVCVRNSSHGNTLHFVMETPCIVSSMS